MIPNNDVLVDMDAKYEMYSGLEEWDYLHDILLCMDRLLSPFVNGDLLQHCKKKIFVQVVERHPIVEEEPERYIPLN